MAQARNPAFFTEIGIDDTVMGRFDVLALHVYLFSRRMKQGGDPKALALGQEIFDLFMSDIERALREVGIGDTSVPKRKKAMAKSFYGLIEDVEKPLDAGDHALLEQKIHARYYKDKVNAPSKLLVEYLCICNEKLLSQSISDIYRGDLSWPDPSSLPLDGKPVHA
ncbi:MAG: ubiquinol-cytochrome C chaperone family protein [Pseudomonadota bacterium]